MKARKADTSWRDRALDLAEANRGKSARTRVAKTLGTLAGRGVATKVVSQLLVLPFVSKAARQAAQEMHDRYVGLTRSAHDLAAGVRRFHKVPPDTAPEDRGNLARAAERDPLVAVADLIKRTVPKLPEWTNTKRARRPSIYGVKPDPPARQIPDGDRVLLDLGVRPAEVRQLRADMGAASKARRE